MQHSVHYSILGYTEDAQRKSIRVVCTSKGDFTVAVHWKGAFIYFLIAGITTAMLFCQWRLHWINSLFKFITRIK